MLVIEEMYDRFDTFQDPVALVLYHIGVPQAHVVEEHVGFPVYMVRLSHAVQYITTMRFHIMYTFIIKCNIINGQYNAITVFIIFLLYQNHM